MIKDKQNWSSEEKASMALWTQIPLKLTDKCVVYVNTCWVLHEKLFMWSDINYLPAAVERDAVWALEDLTAETSFYARLS